ncbi:berberine bridge enzyme-like 18 [Momordica charantia]|uniref:Berberine bridge enzyme-like 18 n=1 Tax=Momordica charantia TaxID=3673 RepID=A0A6J1DHP3_MOMCH|nr:berberine bridge enzyme-like 18 [Momordica charantia]
MKSPITSLAYIFVVSWFSWVASAYNQENFIHCLSLHSLNTSSILNIIYTSTDPSYSSILNYSIMNERFMGAKTPKPQVIVTPLQVSHIQASIICARKNGFQIRTRSGGHDYEGISYVSDVPFVLVDFVNLRSIDIDVERKVAWVQSGATLGELYYKIAEKSKTLGYPGGVCPTVGVGGHFSGGGYGVMLRKFGLAIDNVIDAYLVDVNGELHDRKSMGEDVFWAIRGGGASFGIILSWKIKLVSVPSVVTVFTIKRNLEENATDLVHRWQYVANKQDDRLVIRIILSGMKSSNHQNGKRLSIEASFSSLFLGKVEELLPIMQRTFPELGMTKEDCTEMSWIESVLYFADFEPKRQPLDVLIDRSFAFRGVFKGKSDYVDEPIPKTGLIGLWELLNQKEVQFARMHLIPYGGKMNEISESETPYPHRAGNLYNIHYVVSWGGDEDIAQKHISWIRKLYNYMTPFVSKNPRGAYVNYRDLDLGINNINEYTSYEKASIWGLKYYKDNFERLVSIKTKVDPTDFFTNQQSIPSLLSSKKRREHETS